MRWLQIENAAMGDFKLFYDAVSHTVGKRTPSQTHQKIFPQKLVKRN